MPRQYPIGETARILGVSVDTIRRWDEQGRIKTRRDRANRRTVSAAEIDRIRGRGEGHDLSARNRFAGVVRKVTTEGLLAQVELEAGPFRVVAVITREAAEQLELAPGVPATALVKATSVMVER